jgi:hypothetical protein
MTGRSPRADGVHAAHVLYGGALVLRPAPLVARVAGGSAGTRAVAVVRVLGGRHLVQGLAGLAVSRRVSPRLGAAVDGVHAASMIGLALLDREHRRGAAASALVAVAFVLAGGWAGGGG